MITRRTFMGALAATPAVPVLACGRADVPDYSLTVETGHFEAYDYAAAHDVMRKAVWRGSVQVGPVEAEEAARA